jgi:hypothetical protein
LSRGCDELGWIVMGMDILAVVIGIVTFLILLLLIEGIDRV